MSNEEQEIIDDVEPTTEPTTNPDPITGEAIVADASEAFTEYMTEETPQGGDNTPDLRAVTQTVMKTVQVDEIIMDYSAESLAAYQTAGFTAYAVYDDGTEVQVPWSSVTKPQTVNDVISLEGLDVAMANNQHFWQRSTDTAHDGAGTGAFVTDDEQDDFLEAAADGFDDLSNNKPWHNLLMNSLGILLRTGIYNLVSITRSAIAFFDGSGNASTNIVASFGTSGFQIGSDNKSHMTGDYHSMQLVDKEGLTYFHVSDLRDSTGRALLTDTFRTTEATTTFDLNFKVAYPYSGDNTPTVTVDDVELEVASFSNESHSPLVDSHGVVVLESAVPAGKTVFISYSSPSTDIKAYTLGRRNQGTPGVSGRKIGAYSVAEGFYTTVSGHYSHGEGYICTASGNYSHAEGYNSIADGYCSHAEGHHGVASGSCSHAEGDSEASGGASHSEGMWTKAIGDNSHAEGYQTWATGLASHSQGYLTEANGRASHSQGWETIATGNCQTALGKYNVEDTNHTYAVIVGNGTDNSRSNALTVDWNGNVVASGEVTATDINITGGITYQGEPTYLQSTNIDRDGTNPSSNTTGNASLRFHDKDDEYIGSMYSYRYTDGRQRVSIQAVNEKNDASQVTNALSVIVARDGTQTYAVSNQAAFRSAIGLGTDLEWTTGLSKIAWYMKRGRFVTVAAYGNGDTQKKVSSSWTTLFTLPSGYRPLTHEVRGYCTNYGSSADVVYQIATDGKVQVYSTASNDPYWCFHITFPVA